MRPTPSRRNGILIIFRLALRNWSVLLCFEMIYKGAAFLFFFPFLRFLLSLLPGLAGQPYLGQENIGFLFQSPAALLLLIVILLLASFFIYFEVAALLLYSEMGWQQETTTLWALLHKTVSRTLTLFHPKRIASFFMLPVMMLSVFTIISGYLRLIQFPDFILEYLLEKPLLFGGFLLLLRVFHVVFFLYLFGLPAMLIHGATFLQSWRESLRLLKAKKRKTALLFIAYLVSLALFILLAFLLSTGLLAGALRLLLGADADRDQFYQLTLSFSGIWTLMAGVLLSVFLCSAIIALYHRYRQDERPVASRSRLTLRRAIFRIFASLGTLAILIVFSESEIGGYDWSLSDLPPKIVAHRAGAFFGPENTVAALQNAIHSKAEMAEIDVQQLQDGTLIVMHDTNFKRTTGTNLAVWDANLSDLERLDAGSSFSSYFAGEPVPTLEQMLQVAKGQIQLMIELKATGHEKDLVLQALRLIRSQEMQDQCVIASMSLDLLREVKKQEPSMKTVYISVLLLSPQYGLDAIDAYSVETTSLSRSLVLQAHYQDKEVYAWTANSENTIQKIMKCQADGLITDNPYWAEYCLDSQSDHEILDLISGLFFPNP